MSRSSVRRSTGSRRTAPVAVKGRGRSGWPAAPPGPRSGPAIDATERLRLLDYGDAPVVPFEVEMSRAAIEATVGEVVAAGAIPFTLGGDHSITLPALRACAKRHGKLGLVHFDTHTDTDTETYLHTDNHGTMMRALVTEGHVDPARYAQVGLRGTWPGTEVFAWQAEMGIAHFTAEDVRRQGIDDIVRAAIAIAGQGPCYLSVDIDVLDPAFAGPTGTPEAGGLEPRELVAAARALGRGARPGRGGPGGGGPRRLGHRRPRGGHRRRGRDGDPHGYRRSPAGPRSLNARREPPG